MTRDILKTFRRPNIEGSTKESTKRNGPEVFKVNTHGLKNNYVV